MERAKAEVLRYLGGEGQALSPELTAMVDECMALMRREAKPRHVCRTWGICFGEAGIALARTNLLLPGEDIRRHLGGCERVTLLAATLGVQADALIRLSEGADITKALVLDACATQYIEEYCDRVEEELRGEAKKGGLMLTSRFSPGYGDLPLHIQPDILAALDAGKRIGLTCMETMILLPRKSVTALMGWGENVCETQRNCGKCESCDKKDTCRFRKGTDTYGFTGNS